MLRSILKGGRRPITRPTDHDVHGYEVSVEGGSTRPKSSTRWTPFRSRDPPPSRPEGVSSRATEMVEFGTDQETAGPSFRVQITVLNNSSDDALAVPTNTLPKRDRNRSMEKLPPTPTVVYVLPAEDELPAPPQSIVARKETKEKKKDKQKKKEIPRPARTSEKPSTKSKFSLLRRQKTQKAVAVQPTIPEVLPLPKEISPPPVAEVAAPTGPPSVADNLLLLMTPFGFCQAPVGECQAYPGIHDDLSTLSETLAPRPPTRPPLHPPPSTPSPQQGQKMDATAPPAQKVKESVAASQRPKKSEECKGTALTRTICNESVNQRKEKTGLLRPILNRHFSAPPKMATTAVTTRDMVDTTQIPEVIDSNDQRSTGGLTQAGACHPNQWDMPGLLVCEHEDQPTESSPSRTKRLPADSIWTACRINDEEFVRSVIQNTPQHIHDLSPEGRSPLYLAAHGGHANLVEMLLQAGAIDPDGVAYQSALNSQCRKLLKPLPKKAEKKGRMDGKRVKPEKAEKTIKPKKRKGIADVSADFRAQEIASSAPHVGGEKTSASAASNHDQPTLFRRSPSFVPQTHPVVERAKQDFVRRESNLGTRQKTLPRKHTPASVRSLSLPRPDSKLKGTSESEKIAASAVSSSFVRKGGPIKDTTTNGVELQEGCVSSEPSTLQVGGQGVSIKEDSDGLLVMLMKSPSELSEKSPSNNNLVQGRETRPPLGLAKVFISDFMAGKRGMRPPTPPAEALKPSPADAADKGMHDKPLSAANGATNASTSTSETTKAVQDKPTTAADGANKLVQDKTSPRVDEIANDKPVIPQIDKKDIANGAVKDCPVTPLEIKSIEKSTSVGSDNRSIVSRAKRAITSLRRKKAPESENVASLVRYMSNQSDRERGYEVTLNDYDSFVADIAKIDSYSDSSSHDEDNERSSPDLLSKSSKAINCSIEYSSSDSFDESDESFEGSFSETESDEDVVHDKESNEAGDLMTESEDEDVDDEDDDGGEEDDDDFDEPIPDGPSSYEGTRPKVGSLDRAEPSLSFSDVEEDDDIAETDSDEQRQYPSDGSVSASDEDVEQEPQTSHDDTEELQEMLTRFSKDIEQSQPQDALCEAWFELCSCYPSNKITTE